MFGKFSSTVCNLCHMYIKIVVCTTKENLARFVCVSGGRGGVWLHHLMFHCYGPIRKVL